MSALAPKAGAAAEPTRYVSTRGRMPAARFCDVLLGGLAPDGGLVVPQAYPRFDADELGRLRALSYPELASAIIGRFVDDIPREELDALIRRAYRADIFGSPEIWWLHKVVNTKSFRQALFIINDVFAML